LKDSEALPFEANSASNAFLGDSGKVGIIAPSSLQLLTLVKGPGKGSWLLTAKGWGIVVTVPSPPSIPRKAHSGPYKTALSEGNERRRGMGVAADASRLMQAGAA
jgi:hypothetical protein